jgi:glycosyltransferase involved in cell wall biosynthesis
MFYANPDDPSPLVGLKYRDLRAGETPLPIRELWSQRGSKPMLDTVADARVGEPSARPPRRTKVLFISGAPLSVGHIYRVQHTAAALNLHGWNTRVMDLRDPKSIGAINHADIVTVFRARWDERFASVRNRCTMNRIPLVYDIDDLVFEPAIISADHVAYLDGRSERYRKMWTDDAMAYRNALRMADAVTLTTRPLAEFASRHCAKNFVLPNALGPEMEMAVERTADVRKPSHGDGRQRILFASGTSSHHRDFAEAANAVARVFSRHPEPLLVILGQLDTRLYTELKPHRNRILSLPTVPFDQLIGQVSLNDINLCPLESENPFCECKSAVRWLAAAAVGVPSIVSPTQPLKNAVIHQISGIVASSDADWEEAIDDLVASPDKIGAMGSAARSDANARFGFSGWALRVAHTYETILNTCMV